MNMAHRPDSDIVTFLLKQDNLPWVLEILRFGDTVKQQALHAVWERLKCELDHTCPSTLPPLRIELRKRDERFDGVVIYLSEPKQRQLFYAIEHIVVGSGLELYYGLHWIGEVDEKNPIQQLPDVSKLKDQQRKKGFQFNHDWAWFGWKYLNDGRFSDAVDFLLFAHNEKNQFVTRQAAMLWHYVQESQKQVTAVNRAIG